MLQESPEKERKKKMYQLMSIEVATKLGIHAAIAAQCLIDGMEGTVAADTECAKGEVWVRMGHKTLALYAPYLTPHMAKRALRKLVDKKICRTEKLNDSPFDHTLWYAFTDYGHQLMHMTTGKEN
jgi:hypothetical protein